MTKYDDEIREVETRLENERRALRTEAENLTTTVRSAAVSPKGLLAAAALGFAFGKLTGSHRRRRGAKEARTDHHLQPAAKALGLGGLLGSAALTFIRSRYGSPWVLASRALHYYQMQKRAQMHRQARGEHYAHARPPSRGAEVQPRAGEPMASATTGASVRTDSDVVPMQGDSTRRSHVAN